MRAYIINLDRAEDRWASVSREFQRTRIEVRRISAVDGDLLEFPNPDYSKFRYEWFHGRPTNPRHVGCYFSHLLALEAFLKSEDQHALIGEDDLTLGPAFEAVLERALALARHWNIIRLTGLGQGHPAQVADLGGGYGLHVNFGRVKGTGAYLIDRAAARAWVTQLRPMRLPIDHALDREWFQGQRALCLLPFPASQLDAGFRSSIQLGKTQKVAPLRRWVGTYPYQAINECSRWIFRALSYISIRRTVPRPPVQP